MGKPRKRIIRSGLEQDFYTGWKKWLCYAQRSKIGKWVKRQTHKRERQEGKREAQDGR